MTYDICTKKGIYKFYRYCMIFLVYHKLYTYTITVHIFCSILTVDTCPTLVFIQFARWRTEHRVSFGVVTD